MLPPVCNEQIKQVKK